MRNILFFTFVLITGSAFAQVDTIYHLDSKLIKNLSLRPTNIWFLSSEEVIRARRIPLFGVAM
jgi:hypothetical protein